MYIWFIKFIFSPYYLNVFYCLIILYYTQVLFDIETQHENSIKYIFYKMLKIHIINHQKIKNILNDLF